MKTVTHLNQSIPATYAAVAQAATNSEHADIIARGLNADKKLLIFTDKTLPNADHTDLTEKDLVTKANMALELMDNTPTNKLEIVSFITTKKLRNGNVLFQLNSTQATAWLRNLDIQKEFLLTYSSNANIHNKLHHIIAELVPISFDHWTSNTMYIIALDTQKWL